MGAEEDLAAWSGSSEQWEKYREAQSMSRGGVRIGHSTCCLQSVAVLLPRCLLATPCRHQGIDQPRDQVNFTAASRTHLSCTPSSRGSNGYGNTAESHPPPFPGLPTQSHVRPLVAKAVTLGNRRPQRSSEVGEGGGGRSPQRVSVLEYFDINPQIASEAPTFPTLWLAVLQIVFLPHLETNPRYGRDSFRPGVERKAHHLVVNILRSSALCNVNRR